MENRRSNILIKNVVVDMAGKVVLALLKFAVRTAFIYTLSESYLGISGLFTSILSALSLAEAGIGSAIVFAMYKPLAQNDVGKIKSLVRLYKKAYRLIGLIFFGAGLLLLPFLPRLLYDATDLVNIYFVYMLYLLNSTASYGFFAYKRALVNADQKTYIISLYTLFSLSATYVAALCSLFLLRDTPMISFYAYTIINIGGSVATNLLVSRKVDRIYPYINDPVVAPLSGEEKKGIFRNVTALSLSKLCAAAMNAVDNIVITSVIVGGLSIVGVYSNYLLIISAANFFLTGVTEALAPSLGNLIASEPREKQTRVFGTLNLLFFWMYGFVAICLWVLFNPFIAGVWINSDWILSETSAFLIALNFLLVGVVAPSGRFVAAGGLYWDVKYMYALAAALNIGLSLLFAGPLNMGIEGVLLATTASILAMTALEPYFVCKKILGVNPRKYYFGYLVSIALVLGTGALIKLACSPLSEYNFVNFVIRLAACIVVPNGLWYLIYGKTPEFEYLLATAKTALQKISGRLKKSRVQ